MSARHPDRCEAVPAPGYGRCGGPAHWYVDADGIMVCEDHAMAYLREGSCEVTGLDCGTPVEIGDDGELREAS